VITHDAAERLRALCDASGGIVGDHEVVERRAGDRDRALGGAGEAVVGEIEPEPTVVDVGRRAPRTVAGDREGTRVGLPTFVIARSVRLQRGMRQNGRRISSSGRPGSPGLSP